MDDRVKRVRTHPAPPRLRGPATVIGARPPAPPRLTAWQVVTTTSRWGVRLLVLALVAYGVARVFARLSVVTVPLLVALLLTALVAPLRSWLDRAGLPRAAATLLTFLVLLLGLALVGWVVTMRATAEGPHLVADVQHTLSDVRSTLAKGPFGLGSLQVSQLQARLTTWASQNRGPLVSDAFTGVGLTLRAVFGILLTLLLTVILVWDGDRLWRRLASTSGARWSRRVDDAGRAAWHSVSGYVHGSVAIATFHGTVIGVTLVLLGVPLASVLALLVFLGGFIPLVGAVVTGGIAVLVALATQGVAAALIVLGVLLVASQVDAHVLQPLVMRRFVRLHPIVTALTVTGFGVVWGIPGALIAVPLSSTVGRVVPVLMGRAEVDQEGGLRPLSGSSPTPGRTAPGDGTADRSRAAPSPSSQRGDNSADGMVTGERRCGTHHR